MAKPVHFAEENDVLLKPEGMTEEQCLDLPIHRKVSNIPGTTLMAHEVISCWEFTDKELEEIKKTGRVYLTSQSQTHPPISVSGINPLIRQWKMWVEIEGVTFGIQRFNMNNDQVSGQFDILVPVMNSSIYSRLKKDFTSRDNTREIKYKYEASDGTVENGVLIGCTPLAISGGTSGYVTIAFDHLVVPGSVA